MASDEEGSHSDIFQSVVFGDSSLPQAGVRREDPFAVIAADDWTRGYDDLKLGNPSKNTEQPCLATSTEFIAHTWEGRGEDFGVVSIFDVGECAAEGAIVVKAHTSPITDIQFSPFYPSIVASIAEDGALKVWDIPACDMGADAQIKDHVCLLAPAKPSRRRSSIVGGPSARAVTSYANFLTFNPIAEFLVAVAGPNNSVTLWDIEECAPYRVTAVTEPVTSLVSSQDATLLAASFRDKSCKVYDPRAPRCAFEWPLESVDDLKNLKYKPPKSTKLCWLDGLAGNPNFMLSTGAVSGGARGLKFWDLRKSGELLEKHEVDSGLQPLRPFWDESTGLLYLTAYGEKTVRCYKVSPDNSQILELKLEHRLQFPATASTFLPKHGVDVNKKEVARMFRGENLNCIRPTSFVVPLGDIRHIETIYPPFIAPEVPLSTAQWLQGTNAEPKRHAIKRGEGPYSDASTSSSSTGPPDKSYVKQPSRTPQQRKYFSSTPRMLATRAFLQKELTQERRKCEKLEGDLHRRETELGSMQKVAKQTIDKEVHLRMIKQMEADNFDKDYLIDDLKNEIKLLKCNDADTTLTKEVLKEKDEEIERLKQLLKSERKHQPGYERLSSKEYYVNELYNQGEDGINGKDMRRGRGGDDVNSTESQEDEGTSRNQRNSGGNVPLGRDEYKSGFWYTIPELLCGRKCCNATPRNNGNLTFYDSLDRNYD